MKKGVELSVAADLDSLEALIGRLSAKDRAELDRLVEQELSLPFIPNPGPQTEALYSEADILLYGGMAGGGKTALEVGCPALNHQDGIVFRREATQLDGIIKFGYEVLGGIGDFNKVERQWTLNDGRQLKFAGLKEPDDWRKHAGNPRDYMAFDEAGEFLREQVFSLIGWLRTTVEGQRCRVILGSNPPRGGDGEWLIREFSPWLDPENGVRAKPGELLWAISVGEETQWVDGPGVYEVGGEEYEALSRTFIPASLDDNPYLDKSYRARLQALPEPLRSQLLYGDFSVGREDHEWQVIPTDWIVQAQNRWASTPPEDTPMSAVACDVAQGGPDKTQIQARYGYWYGRFHSLPGSETPDGPSVAAEIVKVMRDRCRVIVDAGGGYGGDTLTQLAHADVDCVAFKGSEASRSKSRDGLYGFKNLRAQFVWQFREALDPDYQSQIALPPDPELRADLAAFRYEVKAQGGQTIVQVGDKEDMKKRLGRSPDKGDTTIMNYGSHAGGLKRPAAAREKTKTKVRARPKLTQSSMKDRLRGRR